MEDNFRISEYAMSLYDTQHDDITREVIGAPLNNLH